MNDRKFNKQSENFNYWESKASHAIGDDITDRVENDEVCISITNDKFMRDIFNFKTPSADHSPLVCSIKGDPTSAAWIAQQYPVCVESEDLNWYFAPSIFSRDSDGKFHAKAKLADAVQCIVLDDVGERLSFEALKSCIPTWVIQTSPSSYQVGFAFHEPQTDLDGTKALISVIRRLDKLHSF